MWRAHVTLHNVASFKTIALNLVGCNVDVIGRREIVIVAWTEETIAVRHDLKDAISRNNIREVELFTHIPRHVHWRIGIVIHRCATVSRHGRIIEHVVIRNRSLVFDRNIKHSNEIGSVARVSFPYAVGNYFTLFVNGLVVSLYLSLQLGNEFFIGYTRSFGWLSRTCWCLRSQSFMIVFHALLARILILVSAFFLIICRRSLWLTFCKVRKFGGKLVYFSLQFLLLFGSGATMFRKLLKLHTQLFNLLFDSFCWSFVNM